MSKTRCSKSTIRTRYDCFWLLNHIKLMCPLSPPCRIWRCQRYRCQRYRCLQQWNQRSFGQWIISAGQIKSTQVVTKTANPLPTSISACTSISITKLTAKNPKQCWLWKSPEHKQLGWAWSRRQAHKSYCSTEVCTHRSFWKNWRHFKSFVSLNARAAISMARLRLIIIGIFDRVIDKLPTVAIHAAILGAHVLRWVC